MEQKLKKTLKEALENFQGANGSEDNLKDEFKKLAEQFFFGGYLLVNDKKIYLTDIEFYYHEDKDGGIKDYIMYRKDEKDYFTLGSLYAHLSGIDFTFENKENKYKASVLIRGYKIEGKQEDRPTYLYNYLLDNFSLFEEGLRIKWQDEHTAINDIPKPIVRVNVPQFKNSKEKMPLTGDENDNDKTKNKKYIQCQRRWRYKIEN
jgi:hypothetical protein